MSDDQGEDLFELEPEGDALPEPSVPAGREPKRQNPDEVDEQTVAERRGEARSSMAEERPLPPGWPNEAFRFPLVSPGPGLIVAGTLAMAVLDLAAAAMFDLRFLFLIVKIAFVWVLLHGQLSIAAQSAMGRDEPVGWRESTNITGDQIFRTMRFVAWLALFALPGILFIAVGHRYIEGVLWFLAASLYGPVMGLGLALGDPRMKWPWNAVAWIFKRPLVCVAGSVGWWALVGSELSAQVLIESGPVATAMGTLPARAATAYLLLVSARAMGVLGRAWTL